jgi:hypothetical protein
MKKILLLLFLCISLQGFSQIPVARLEATDPEGEEVYWVITAGNTQKFFSITPCSAVIKVDSMAYNSFIRQKTFYITFKASDPQGNYSKTVRKIILKKTSSGVKVAPEIYFVS